MLLGPLNVTNPKQNIGTGSQNETQTQPRVGFMFKASNPELPRGSEGYDCPSLLSFMVSTGRSLTSAKRLCKRWLDQQYQPWTYAQSWKRAAATRYAKKFLGWFSKRQTSFDDVFMPINSRMSDMSTFKAGRWPMIIPCFTRKTTSKTAGKSGLLGAFRCARPHASPTGASRHHPHRVGSPQNAVGSLWTSGNFENIAMENHHL